MSIGDVDEAILLPLPARSTNKGKVESWASDSNSAESIYALVLPANPSFAFRGQAGEFS